MNLGELIRLLVNVLTVITIAIVLAVMFFVINKRHDLKKEMGVSAKTYLWIVGIVEVIYDIGLLLILYSMGVNIIQHLQNLEFGKILSAINAVDVSKMKYAGKAGWIGFSINCAVTFIAPAYLLIKGGKKLPKVIYGAAWLEIGLESIVISLVFLSLFLG